MATSDENPPIAPEGDRPFEADRDAVASRSGPSDAAESTPAESAAPDSDPNDGPPLDELRKEVEAALGRVEAMEASTRKTVAELNSHLRPLRTKTKALKPIKDLSAPSITAMIKTASAESQKVKEDVDKIAEQIKYDHGLRCALCDAIDHQWQRYWAETGGRLDDWSPAVGRLVVMMNQQIQAATEQVVAKERRWLD